MMDSFFILYLLFSSASIASAQDGACKACNCQFNNVDVLNQLIDRRIATAPQPGELILKFYSVHAHACMLKTMQFLE